MLPLCVLESSSVARAILRSPLISICWLMPCAAVVDLDPDGFINHVYCDMDELPTGVHALAREFQCQHFPTQPSTFAHEAMRPHLRRLIERISKIAECCDSCSTKLLAPDLYELLSSAVEPVYTLFEHDGIKASHTTAAWYCTGEADDPSPVSYDYLCSLADECDDALNDWVRFLSSTDCQVWSTRSSPSVECTAKESATACVANRNWRAPHLIKTLPPIKTHHDEHDMGSKPNRHRLSAVPGMSTILSTTDGEGGVDMLCHSGGAQYSETAADADAALDAAASAASNAPLDAARAQALMQLLDESMLESNLCGQQVASRTISSVAHNTP